MQQLKRIGLVGLFIVGSCLFFNHVIAQDDQTTKPESLRKEFTSVTFTPEDIESIKTLLEKHYDRKISPLEFERFGVANRENIALFREIDATLKDDVHFSQEHITYLIESMEERLGMTKPRPQYGSKYAGSRNGRRRY